MLLTTKRRSLVDVVRDHAERQPDGRAYTFLDAGEDEGDRLTWAGLDRQSRAIAAAIASRVPRQSRVLLMFPPGLTFVPSFLGVLYAGTIAVPVYPPTGGRVDRTVTRLRGMITDAGITLIVAPASVRDRAAALEALVPELGGIEWLVVEDVPEAMADDWIDCNASGGLAFLQYTSGSTAVPRGVMVSHGNLLHNLAYGASAAGHDRDSVSVSWLPVNHDMGLIEGVLQAAYSGFPAYLMAPAAFLQRPMRWLQAVSRLRATHSGGPNFAYDLCVRKIPRELRSSLDLSSWQVAFNGAEPVRAETLLSFQQAFGECGFQWSASRPAYGLAESTLMVTCTTGEGPKVMEVDSAALTSGRLSRVVAPASGSTTLVASGVVTSESAVMIVDQAGRRLSPNHIGEIWIDSLSVALGYWQRPVETQATFGARLADSGAGPFLRSGDLGAVCDDHLFVTGRIKDVLIVRGLKHYPQDLEQTAERAHPALRIGSCAAFASAAVDDEGVTILAEVDPRSLKAAQSEGWLSGIVSAVRMAIADRHSVTLGAVALVPAGSLPKTTSGKLQRYLCRTAFSTGSIQILQQWAPEPATADAAL